MYMNSGIVGMNSYAPQVLPSNNHPYANGRPTKKRRSTATSSSKAPLPTPTSATHPHIPGLSDSTNHAESHDPSAPSTSLPPYTPPGASNNNNSNGLNLSSFSPNFSFSPLPQLSSLAPTPGLSNSNQDNSASHFDPMLSMPTPYEQQATPGAASTSGSAHTDPDKDPFLSLLEQLAENEVSRGGPSELDFFLSGPN
jgi:hypothetical protein